MASLRSALVAQASQACADWLAAVKAAEAQVGYLRATKAQGQALASMVLARQDLDFQAVKACERLRAACQRALTVSSGALRPCLLAIVGQENESLLEEA